MSRLLTAISCLMLTQAFACTEFLLMDQNKECVVGRSMEFGTDLQCKIVVVPLIPDGHYYQSMITGQEGLIWEQSYTFIGVTAFDNSQFVIDGMNDQGLSFGIEWFPDAKYPDVSPKEYSRAIALEDVGAWILSPAANIEEVKEAFSKVVVCPNKLQALNNSVPPIHFSFHDRSGKSLVVEFTDSHMNIIDNPVGVLTNSPSFPWQLTNLRNYINLSAKNIPNKTMGTLEVAQTGEGSGMLGLPGDFTPPSRFVKMVLFKQAVPPAADAASNVNLAFHFLNSVDIPKGAIVPLEGDTPDYTQWAIVKDLQNLTLYYPTYHHLHIPSKKLLELYQK